MAIFRSFEYGSCPLWCSLMFRSAHIIVPTGEIQNAVVAKQQHFCALFLNN